MRGTTAGFKPNKGFLFLVRCHPHIFNYLLAPVDGHWGRWSKWSSCSVSCDKGKHNRTRECIDPAPMHGGKDCQGDSKQVGDCEKRRCGLGNSWSLSIPFYYLVLVLSSQEFYLSI